MTKKESTEAWYKVVASLIIGVGCALALLIPVALLVGGLALCITGHWWWGFGVVLLDLTLIFSATAFAKISDV